MTTAALRWLEPRRPEPVLGLDLGARADPLLAGARLDGLLDVGVDGWGGARDVMGSPAVRAGTVRNALRPGTAVCLATAVWVHTGLPHAGPVQTCPLPGGPRLGTVALALDPGDVVDVAGTAVTTPERTACDVARLSPLDQAAAALLALRHGGLDLAAAAAGLRRHGRRPHLQRARDLLAALAG